MLRLLLVTGLWSLVQVNAHPLTQSVHAYPALNYQQSMYRPPYGEALILQSNNNNPYSQPILIQPPLSTSSSLQVPSLLEQISQIYWDKLLSNPSLRNLLDPNKIMEYSNDIKTNPFSSGRIVNNYIILPPDYLKENETFSVTTKSNRKKNELLTPMEKSCSTNQKRKKVLSTDSVKTHVESTNTKNLRNAKKNQQKSWNFNTDNIKCFTPADVLYTETYQPEKTHCKNVEDMKKHRCKNKCKNAKAAGRTEVISVSQKSKKNKMKKISKEKNKTEACKDMSLQNIALLSTADEKKKPNKMLKEFDSEKKDELSYCNTIVAQDDPQSCKQNMNDVLLLNLFQQGCTDLENRQIRNSKMDAAKKDFRNVYPDLSNDLSKSLTWYMNDVYSPQSFQQSLNSNYLLGNNAYPFDFSQIFHIPQYSNADVNKPNGNTGKNNNTRKRKKKKKKNAKPKIRKESISNNDDSNYDSTSDQSEKIVEIPKTTNKTTKIVVQDPETSIPTPETIFENPEKNHQNLQTINEDSESNPRSLMTKSKTLKLNSQINDFNGNTQIISENSLIPVICTEVPEIYTKFPETNTTFAAVSTLRNLDNPVEVQSIINIMLPNESSSVLPAKNITVETGSNKSIVSMAEVLDSSIKPMHNNDNYNAESLNKFDRNEVEVNIKSQEDNYNSFKEKHETKIPETIERSKNNKVNADMLIKEEKAKKREHNALDSYTSNQIPELETEDETLYVFDNRLLEDYYPDFTADNHAYLVSEEEIDFRNIHDRYFYTTDKNMDSREIYSPEQKNLRSDKKEIYAVDELSNENLIETYNMRNIENDKSEEIVFKTPPGLEVPGFVTRKINRDKQDSTEIYYQHNNYEDNFDRLNLDSFADRSDYFVETADRYATNENKSRSLVETVYAKTKVVKYGQAQDFNKSSKPEIKKYPTLEDFAIQNDGEKTIVIAKSLQPEDFW